MNPITNAKNQQKLAERELSLGLTNKKSWHDQFKESAWIFVGGLPYDLTEGDIICVFSQWRDTMKGNPEEYKKFKAVDALQKKLYRKNPLSNKQRVKMRASNRERQRKFREMRKV